MAQSLLDRVLNGTPKGGSKTNGVVPVRFLRDVPAAPMPPPPRREAVELNGGFVQARPPQHGIWWFLAGLAVLVMIVAMAFANRPAEAAGRTTHHETPVEQQRNLPANDTDAATQGNVIVRKPASGVVCPTSSSDSAPYLYGVQTDAACLRYAPAMRR